MRFSNPGMLSRIASLLPLLVLTAGLAISPAADAATAGRVIMAKGKVAAEAAGSRRALARGADILEQDTVATGADSRTQLRFVDRALLTLEAESELVIQEYSFQNTARPDRVLMRLVRGGLRTVTGSIGKTDNQAYRLETPLASIGVRGTMYSAFLDVVNSVLEVVVQQGIVAITTPVDSAAIGSGQQFNGARVRGDGSIELFNTDGEDADTGALHERPGPSDEPGIAITEDVGDGSDEFHDRLEGQP